MRVGLGATSCIRIPLIPCCTHCSPITACTAGSANTALGSPPPCQRLSRGCRSGQGGGRVGGTAVRIR